ncbi:hypothetical protein [Fibrivirga algicola]|uniref:ASCH domain-containing protein n=1 Tax=Fibrivirga algicola TaxID=2950420 RepID=A0ABX0QBE3_9BACT|nr:hypothetical protein [Fibrivirga algicola]NID09409.1 hypothetical protein [Fibrivirga algicola]
MPPIDTPRPKVHTIREDQHKRWKPGMTVHFATGIRTKQYCQFGVGICKSVQKIVIHANPMGIFMIQVDGRVLSNIECMKLSLDDGFDQFSDFESWFANDAIEAGGSKTYRLIHWTDLKY